MKEWLIKLPGLKWAYKQGGIDSFHLASKDIWSSLEEEVDRKAEVLAKEKLAKLLSLVDERAIVSTDKRGLIYIGGELASDDKLVALKAEAEFIKGSDLWKVLCETPRRLAEKAMFIEGDNLDSMKKGRSMLYLLASQENIVKTFASYQKK